MRRTIFVGTTIIYTFLFAMQGGAQTSLLLGGFDPDSDAPVEMTADKLTISQENGSAQFEGNVIIGQGDIRIAANLVVVTYLES